MERTVVMSSPLIPYIIQNYAETKRLYPTEGRRRLKLRIAQQFWTTIGSGEVQPAEHVKKLPGVSAHCIDQLGLWDTDPDPLDGVTRHVPELGLIVRTDFADESSWVAFCMRLQDGEKDLVLGSDWHADQTASEQTDHDGVDDGERNNTGTDDEDEDSPPAIFHIINPSSPWERELLANISNLTALRLFNDVDVRPSPTLPQGARRIDPPNRLVDYHGWQEIYRGKNVWLYDTKSNADECVRVVNQSGDMYGTATGDSWRARASHICELQLNLAVGAIRIDFGGLDRWDFNERRRNMTEAEGL